MHVCRFVDDEMETIVHVGLASHVYMRLTLYIQRTPSPEQRRKKRLSNRADSDDVVTANDDDDDDDDAAVDGRVVLRVRSEEGLDGSNSKPTTGQVCMYIQVREKKKGYHPSPPPYCY